MVRVRGEVDLCNAPGFGTRLHEAAARTGNVLVVDLSDLSFLDCSGLAALAGTRETLRAQGRALVLRGAHGVVRRAIEMSELAVLLEDGPDSADARSSDPPDRTG